MRRRAADVRPPLSETEALFVQDTLLRSKSPENIRQNREQCRLVNKLHFTLAHQTRPRNFLLLGTGLLYERKEGNAPGGGVAVLWRGGRH